MTRSQASIPAESMWITMIIGAVFHVIDQAAAPATVEEITAAVNQIGIDNPDGGLTLEISEVQASIDAMAMTGSLVAAPQVRADAPVRWRIAPERQDVWRSAIQVRVHGLAAQWREAN